MKGKEFHTWVISKEDNLKAVYNERTKRLKFIQNGKEIDEQDVSSFSAANLRQYIVGLRAEYKSIE